MWLAQTKLVYEYAGASLALSPPCYCEHVCNARCVIPEPSATDGATASSSDSQQRCYVGPGVAATWLVLRAAGLA